MVARHDYLTLSINSLYPCDNSKHLSIDLSQIRPFTCSNHNICLQPHLRVTIFRVAIPTYLSIDPSPNHLFTCGNHNICPWIRTYHRTTFLLGVIKTSVIDPLQSHNFTCDNQIIRPAIDLSQNFFYLW